MTWLINILSHLDQDLPLSHSIGRQSRNQIVLVVEQPFEFEHEHDYERESTPTQRARTLYRRTSPTHNRRGFPIMSGNLQ